MKKELRKKYLIKKVIIFFIMLSIVLLNMNKMVYAATEVYVRTDNYQNKYTYTKTGNNESIVCEVKRSGETIEYKWFTNKNAFVPYKDGEPMSNGTLEGYNIYREITRSDLSDSAWLDQNREEGYQIATGRRYKADSENRAYYMYNGNESTPTLIWMIWGNSSSTVSYRYFNDPGEEYFKREGSNTAARERVFMDEIRSWIEGEPRGFYSSGDDKIRDKYTDVDLDETMDSADTFLGMGKDSQEIPETNVKSLSKTIYNTLFAVGIIVAFVVGGILAIKFITGSIEAKVEVKQLLLPYIIGLVVLFGAFTIWKVVINLQKDILPDKNVSVEERNYTRTQTTFGPSSHSSSHSTGEDEEES